jgi:hypothetical protein
MARFLKVLKNLVHSLFSYCGELIKSIVSSPKTSGKVFDALPPIIITNHFTRICSFPTLATRGNEDCMDKKILQGLKKSNKKKFT